jgi:hypothetical protein
MAKAKTMADRRVPAKGAAWRKGDGTPQKTKRAGSSGRLHKAGDKRVK